MNCSLLRKKEKKKTKESSSHSTSSSYRSDTSVFPQPRRYEYIITPRHTNYPSLPNQGFARWQLCSGFVAVQRCSDKRLAAQTAFVTVTKEAKGWFSDAVMRLVGTTVQKRDMRPRAAHCHQTIIQPRLFPF